MQIIPLNLDSVLLFLHNSKLAYFKAPFVKLEAPINRINHDKSMILKCHVFIIRHLEICTL